MDSEEGTLRWECVENGRPRYLSDRQAALLLVEWGASPEEAGRIIAERLTWSLRPESQSLFRLELRPLVWESNAGAPQCPACLASGRPGVPMRGPVDPGPDAGPERIFVCDDCRLTMKDRRRHPRPEP